MSHPLQSLFEPRSVAVVGASTNPQKRGHQVVAALRASGFQGSVYPINPSGGEILGHAVIESIDALPEVPDLAYLARPANAVPGVVGACGRIGIKAAIVPAVGFRESGAEGARLEAEMLARARDTGIRLVGPNTSGVLNTDVGLHMVGGEPLPRGGLGVLAQSGNIALDLMTSASRRPIGISIYVGPGNEGDIGFHEYLEFLGQHEPTRAIVMYVEGVRDGRALFETARAVAAGKPVVALKGGRSSAGGRAARSHTGAITGSYRVFRALARESGIVAVERSDELLPVAETLADQPPPRASGFAVLSDGGGHATLSADHLTAAGIELCTLEPATRDALSALLGPAASVRNPVDVAGASDQAPRVLSETLRLLLADPSCGGVLVTGLFGGYAIRFADALAPEELEAAREMASAAEEAGAPVVVHSLYASRSPAPLTHLLGAGIPVYDSLERAVRCVVALDERGAFLGRAGPASSGPSSATSSATSAGSDGEPRQSAESSGPPPSARWLSETETRELVEPYGVTLVPGIRCDSAASARSAAVSLGGGPYVLKAVSPHLPHKTEAGAVRIDLLDPGAVEVAYEEVLASARAWLGSEGAPADIHGALVSPMMPEPIAEVLLGARRDPQFGPVLSIALGGTAVELLDDVAICRLPTTRADIERSCAELRLSRLLTGYRGRPAVDLGALASIGEALGRCLLETEAILEIELNPVFAYADRAVAIDAVARVAGDGAAGSTT